VTCTSFFVLYKSRPTRICAGLWFSSSALFVAWWLTVRYGNPLMAEFENLGAAEDAYMKAERDERARLRGIRMRKARNAAA